MEKLNLGLSTVVEFSTQFKLYLISEKIKPKEIFKLYLRIKHWIYDWNYSPQ